MKLQVPENISLEWEAWRGFGRAALIPTVLITGAALALAVLYCMVSVSESKMMTAVLIVGLTFAFCAGFFSKLENNQSMFDFLLRQARYKKEQQVFLYHKGKEAVCFVEETEA